MEVSKKSMTDEQLCEKEIEIVKAITEIVDSFREQYAEIGYELSMECTRRNDYEKGYTEVTEEPGDYVNGYSSKARIEVSLPKTNSSSCITNSTEDTCEGHEYETTSTSDEDVSECDESSEESEAVVSETDEESDVIVSETAEEVEEKVSRTKAYTEIMIARLYKVFWMSKISYTDDFSPLKADLEEFLHELKNA